jgi:hypothetical protein
MWGWEGVGEKGVWLRDEEKGLRRRSSVGEGRGFWRREE